MANKRGVQGRNPSIPLGTRGGGCETFDILPEMAPVDNSPVICRLSNAELIGCVLGGMVQEFTVDLHKKY